MPSKKNKKTPIPQTNVVLVVDASGSMQRHADKLNKTVKDLVADFKKAKGQVLLTLMSFQTNYFNKTSINTLLSQRICRDLELDVVPRFSPDGGTPYNEAMVQALNFAKVISTDRSQRTIVTVLTDGEATDNGSSFVNPYRTLMQELASASNVSITAMVPDNSAASLLKSLNVPGDNIKVWDTSGDFAAETSVLRTSFNSYLNSADSKATGFFNVKLDSKKIAKVKSNLKDLRHNFKAFTVDKEMAIQPFVEARGLNYTRGSAYYELTKAETIQPYKPILLQQKGKKKIYGGEEARKILGWPKDLTVKALPTNLQDWKVFVQSTSTNRKLVRGSELLVQVK